MLIGGIAVLLQIGLLLVLWRWLRGQLQTRDEMVYRLQQKLDQYERELAQLEKRPLPPLNAEQWREFQQWRDGARSNLERLAQDQEKLTEEQRLLRAKLEAQFTSRPAPPPRDEVSPDEAKPSEAGDQVLSSYQSPLVKEVVRMLAEGEAPVAIARKKGMQVGEVELIRALHKFSPRTES
ncbi:hypothetical protein SCOR_25625 [Sulfidibacter corallicola]